MKAPDYTVADLVYYAGLLLGWGVTYSALEGILGGILRTVVGLGVGVGTGYVFEKLYRNRNAIKPGKPGGGKSDKNQPWDR